MTRAEFDMILDREIERARLSPTMDFLVLCFVLAFRNRWVGKIRNAEYDLCQFGLSLGEMLFVSLELIADAGNFAPSVPTYPRP